MKLAFALLLLAPALASAKDCRAPWGSVVKNKASVRAWNFQFAPRGFTCRFEMRECRNGRLLGSYSHPDCIETPSLK